MKTIAKNRKALYDFDILDRFEAGIVLSGQEVKSCRNGGANLAGSYVSFFGGKPLLKNAAIRPYSCSKEALGTDYNPHQDRVLLLKKREADKLQSALNEKGVTLIPIEMKAGRHIKVVLGLGRGQKKIDKRQKIKERDMERKMRQGKDI